VIGSDYAVYYGSFTGSSWSGWTNLGGKVYDSWPAMWPAITETTYFSPSGGGYELHVVVMGGSHLLYDRRMDCSTTACIWLQWMSLSGATWNAPQAYAGYCGVRGLDDKVYEAYLG
jgi:hypothetical protein